jgi:hypothetical protein
MIKTVVIVGRDKNKGCAFFFFPFRFFHIASIIIFSRNSSQQIFLWPIIEKKFNHGENTTKKSESQRISFTDFKDESARKQRK